MGAKELVFNECSCTHLGLELPSEILDAEAEIFRSLFSLLNCLHLRQTFCLVCILIRLILTGQEKRLFNWTSTEFFKQTCQYIQL